MGAMIVQLSDLHAKSGKEPIFARADAISRAITTELGGSSEVCVILFNGDAAYGGKRDQFAPVAQLLRSIRAQVAAARPAVAFHILTVPGNHDCDLTSDDQEARIALRQRVGGTMPAASISTVLLAAQGAYFEFAAQFDADWSLTAGSPFYHHFDVVMAGGRRLRFHLLNSSWTSVIHETDDLRYPLPAFAPPTDPRADYAITVIHHPVHWFLMPGVRREFRGLLESASDLVLTGHEHANESSRRKVHEGGEIAYLEGGVLHEEGEPELCIFNIVHLDFDSDEQRVTRFRWVGSHFEPEGKPQVTSILSNPLRSDRRYRLVPKFAESLDELEDPLVHPREPNLRLSHIFAYPELRKIVDASDRDKQRSAVEGVRSEEVVDELRKHPRVIIGAGDKGGKTSSSSDTSSTYTRWARCPC